MLNGKYHTEHFITDNAGSAEKKLSNFLNRSNIEPDQIVSLTHAYNHEERTGYGYLSILLVYVKQVNPFDAHDMGMF